MKIQAKGIVLIDTEEIKPNYNIGFISKVVNKRINNFPKAHISMRVKFSRQQQNDFVPSTCRKKDY